MCIVAKVTCAILVTFAIFTLGYYVGYTIHRCDGEDGGATVTSSPLAATGARMAATAAVVADGGTTQSVTLL